MKLVSLFFLCLAICRGLESKYVPEKRMIGGVPLYSSNLSFIVSIKRQFNKIPVKSCLGTFIDHNWILTSAVCAVDESVNNVAIYTNLYQHTIDDSPYHYYRPERIIIHKNFSSTTGKNDIALIKVREPIQIQTVRLGNETSHTKLMAIGWNEAASSGQENEIPSPLTLGSLEVKTQNITYCQKHVPFLNIDDKQICGIASKGADLCGVDSGGPLFNEKGEQVGIVNDVIFFAGGHNHQCHPGHTHPLVFTNVAKYRNWIDEKIHPNN